MSGSDAPVREGGRRWSSAVGSIAVFTLGFALVAGVVVRDRLVSPDLYLAALEENDAYERAYTEVLADPDFAVVTEQLIGELGLSPETSRHVRVLTTNALRWTLPPARLRAGVESFVVQVLEYVRSEEGALQGDVEVSDIVGRVLETVLAQLGARVALAAETVATSLVEYQDAIAAFADQLAAGFVPPSVPVLGGTTFDPNEVIDVIFAELGERADERLRQRIRVAVLAGSQREALVAAGSAFIAEHAERISAELRSGAISARYVDVVQQLAERAGLREQEIAARLDTVRTAVWWLRWPTAALGGFLMAAAAVSLLRLHRDDLPRAGRALASCGIVAGVGVGAGWLLVEVVVEPPLAPARSTGADAWNLPDGLRDVVADVESTLAAGLEDVVRRLVVVPIAAGATLAVASLVPQLARLPVRGLALGAGATALGVAGFVWRVPADPGIHPPRACNGHVELCERPYDEVVFPATHNSVSSTDARFVWPEHDLDLRGQLDSGVRALMLDTHYWTPLVSGSQLAPFDVVLPPQLAEEVVGAVGGRREGRGGAYLCHSHCALGAKPLADGLRQVRSFLEANPHDVVTLILQDGITRRDTVSAFERAGVTPYLHSHDPDVPWPTLGKLVDAGERLVVFSELHGPPPEWFHDAFEHIQDTAYLFRSPEDLDCDRNRGPGDAPLFLLNHWVQRIAPDRAVAAIVNSRDAIVGRAHRCEAERGQLPNFVAVNFSSIGDLMDAVDALNGV